jgi:hypothetical protein
VDRMTVIGKDGSPYFQIEGDEVLDLKDHEHKPIVVDGQVRCQLCNQPLELEGEDIGN